MNFFLGTVVTAEDDQRRGRIKAMVPFYSGTEKPTDWIERVGPPNHHFPPRLNDVVMILVIPSVGGNHKLFWFGKIDNAPNSGLLTSPRALDAFDDVIYSRMFTVNFVNSEIFVDPSTAFTRWGLTDDRNAFVELKYLEEEIDIDASKINVGIASAEDRGGF